ncbi:MAG: VWA domain-containing protein, partial [Acidobacteriaceae bacterium]|nr:VWA domain-containing protein [Acidobacteriaceae bacterium]
MFEFFFKYPSSLFAKGNLVLLGTWPVWLLLLGILAAAAALGYSIWRTRKAAASSVRGGKSVLVWLLQTMLVALILLLLWQPALNIAALKPQQNIVALIIDDSRSMGTLDNGTSRRDQAIKTLNGGLLKSLQDKFQVRLYRLGDHLERIEKPEQLNDAMPSTHIGANLKEVLAESATLPIGAIVFMSDGSDNSGGIAPETISEIRRQRIPVHTIGYGREQFANDIEMEDVQLPGKTLPNSRVQALVSFRQRGYLGKRLHVSVKENGKVLGGADVVPKNDGVQQTEPVLFNAGAAGVKNVTISIDPQAGEENAKNNQLTRVISVDNIKPRILYMEGEPRWDYKFLRRAVEDDKNIEVVSVLRTTQNKLYRQGIANEQELQEGFPTKVEELFGFQGIILGSVEAAYFTPQQQELIQQFVDRR